MEGWGLLPGPGSSGQSSGRWQGDHTFLKSGPVTRPSPHLPLFSAFLSASISAPVTGCLTHHFSALTVFLSSSLHSHGLSLSIPCSLAISLILSCWYSVSLTTSLPLILSLTSLLPVTISFSICLSSLSQSLDHLLIFPFFLSASLSVFLTWFPHSGKRSGRCWERRT